MAATLLTKFEDWWSMFAMVGEYLAALSLGGLYSRCTSFSMVVACFGSVLHYIDIFETIRGFGVLKDLPWVQTWRVALAKGASVQCAVGFDYQE
jgi:hypothetical protein